MANIWAGQRQNNENHGQMLSGNSKQFLSARKHSAKKQVFGELKNIIHNQGDATPLKGFNIRNSVAPTPSKSSLCIEVLRRQQLKQNFSEAQKQLEKKLVPRMPREVAPAPDLKFSIAEDSFFDFFDVPTNACDEKCSKSLEEIWGEMNGIDEAFLTKVINGGDPDSDEEIDKDQFRDYDYDYKFDKDTDIPPLCISDKAHIGDALPLFELHMPDHALDLDDDCMF